MLFEQKLLSPGEFYRIMLQAIVPRPIAWVLSRNSDQSFNVAPFSFFNGVASEPPLLMIAVARKDDDSRKDTWVNIDERTDFVVHIPPMDQAEAMVATSKALPPNESELAFAKLETVPVDGQPLPRLKGPRVAMFCRKHAIHEVGAERVGLILGEIAAIWADDAIVSGAGARAALDPAKIDPVSRLGLKWYGGLANLRQLERPKPTEP